VLLLVAQSKWDYLQGGLTRPIRTGLKPESLRLVSEGYRIFLDWDLLGMITAVEAFLVEQDAARPQAPPPPPSRNPGVRRD
jgi:hypothetical protein